MVTEEKRSLQAGAVLNPSITYARGTFPGYHSSLLPSLTLEPLPSILHLSGAKTQVSKDPASHHLNILNGVSSGEDASNRVLFCFVLFQE